MGQNLVKELAQATSVSNSGIAALWSQYSEDGIMSADRWKKFLKDWANSYQQDYKKKTQPEAQGLLVAQGIISGPTQRSFTVPYRTFREFIVQRMAVVDDRHSRPARGGPSQSMAMLPGIISRKDSADSLSAVSSDPLCGYQTLELSDELRASFTAEAQSQSVGIWKELEYLPSNRLILYQPGTRNMFNMSRATLNQLVALLVVRVPAQRIIDQYEYIQRFFWIYPSVSTGSAVYAKLAELWAASPRAESLKAAVPDPDVVALRCAILDCFRHWVVTFPSDFDAEITRQLTRLIRGGLQQPQYARKATRIREVIMEKRRSTMGPSASASHAGHHRQLHESPPGAPEWTTVSLFEVDLKLVAQQLAIRALGSFNKIARSEFAAWLRDDYAQAPNLAFFNARFEVLSSKMSAGILACKSPTDRLALLQRAIDLGLEMFLLNNVADGLAIAACLHSPHIRRLTSTFEQLSNKYKFAIESFDRHLLRSEDPAAFNIWQLSLPRPTVLYLGTFRSQFLSETSSSSSSLIDMHFHFRVYELFCTIHTKAPSVYPFLSDPYFGKLLQRLRTLPQDQQEALSHAIEPPKKSSF